MCELSQFSYTEGSIVWVKLGSCWWPGEVTNVDSLPEEILHNLKKKPFTAVKFFDEDKYEYVRNLNNICLYNNRRKDEFIKKGLDMARAKAKEGSTVMKKFPSDVVTAECRTGGDPNILTSDTFAPRERLNYRDIFGESPGKKKLSKKSTSPNKSFSERKAGKSPSNGQSKSWKDLEIPTPERVVPKITHRRFISESDHEVRIRQQPCTPPKEEAKSPNNNYKCHVCGFTSSRLNVIVLHNKAQHSESAVAAAKQQTPAGKKKRTPIGKPSSTSSVSKPRSKSSEVKDAPSKAKKNILSDSEKKSGLEEVVGDKSSPSLRKKGKTNAKKKRETEVRESLLADWDEEDEEEEEKEIENLKMVLGSSRKQEEEITNQSVDETIKPAKEDVSNEMTGIESTASPEKITDKPAESQDLELEFKSIMEETALPVLPDVPIVNSSTPVKDESRDSEIAEKQILEPGYDDKVRKDSEITGGIAAPEKIADSESNEMFESPSNNVTEPELKNNDIPPCKTSSEELLGTPLTSTVSQSESQIAEIKSEPETNVVAPSNQVSSPVVTMTNAGSVNVSSSINVTQEAFGILPITTDSQKTEMTANMVMNMPASNSVEGITTRTLVSAASPEETTETATYVLVTIDDSGALQHIDNMNTALLALDGQQDGPRTLYIDSSHLGTQATDLENIFLAIDPRGDMATQMVELTNRNSEQTEGQGQAFSTTAAASAAKAKSAQDILAVALANTQVFQGDGSYVAINPAASAVTVTSSRTAQAPVMTPRVVDPCRSNAIPPAPTTISSTPAMPEIGGNIGEVQRPVNLPPPTIEATSFHSQLPPPAQTLSTIPSVIQAPNQAAVVTLPNNPSHLNSDDSSSRLETSAMSNMLTLPSLIPPTYAPVGVGNGQTAATLTLISGANLIMDQVTQALPKVGTDSVVATSRDHVAEKRKLECDVRESKQMRVDENGGS